VTPKPVWLWTSVIGAAATNVIAGGSASRSFVLAAARLRALHLDPLVTSSDVVNTAVAVTCDALYTTS